MRIRAIGLCLGVALSVSVALCTQPPAVEWEKMYRGLGAARGYAVQQTSDGGLVATGWTQATAGSQPNEEPNGYLVKTDDQGNLKWESEFGGADSVNECYSVQQTMDGGYVMTGFVNDTLGSFDKLLLVKTDSAGCLEWEQKYRKQFDGRNRET